MTKRIYPPHFMGRHPKVMLRHRNKATTTSLFRQMIPGVAITLLGSLLTLMGVYLGSVLQFKSAEIDRAEKYAVETQDMLIELHENLVSISKGLSGKAPEDQLGTIKAIIVDIPARRRKFLKIHTHISIFLGLPVADQLINLNPLQSNTSHSEQITCKSDDTSVASSIFDLYVQAACAIGLTAAARFPIMAAKLDASKLPIPNAHESNMAVVYQRLEEFERASSAVQYSILSYINQSKPIFLGLR